MVKALKITVFLLISVFFGCTEKKEKNDFDLIEDVEVRKVIEFAMSNSGELDKWRELKELNFDKISILFLEDGTIEDSTNQSIHFGFHPEFSADISWQKDSSMYRVMYKRDTTYFSVNDSITSVNDRKRHNLVMSALYTVGMPYKLMDKGTTLTQVGSKVIEGVSVETIKAGYDTESNSNHSSNEVWWYYFDDNTGKFVGSMVYHPPTYAFIENTSFAEANGLKFPSHRLSFRVDSLGTKQFLRGEFFYKNFAVRF
ncbi:MAG: hypothetical protein AB8B73_08425 [Ekhidna sp.]